MLAWLDELRRESAESCAVAILPKTDIENHEICAAAGTAISVS